MAPSTDLDAFLAAIDELSAQSGCSRVDFLLEHGLRVHETLERWTYSSTPMNSLTFASTGGDGVHFGLLQSASAPARNGPVVMTVPMATQANHVVAESIAEFLGLGCIQGWFSLEQLAYRPAYALELYADAGPPIHAPIAKLFAKLSLIPGGLRSARLEELAQRYGASIVLAAAEAVAEPVDLEAFLAWKRATYGEKS